MEKFNNLSKPVKITIITFACLLLSALLFYISRINYLLFHTSAELFSIVIAVAFFIIVWNAREYSDSTALLRIGTAYLFIALLDLLHTLSYKGMAIFTDYDYYANQVWIATRYIESLTLFILLLITGRSGQKKRYGIVFIVYSLLTAAVIGTVFIWKVFPVCFIEGSGLTPFKKISEYIISAFLAGAGVVLYLRRKRFDNRVYRYLLVSIILTIGSELAFTFYIDNYGLSNFIGHMLKIASFFLIYKAIIETAFKEPVELLFNRLRESNSEKDRLFSIIAHDLKNPFSGIESSSKLMLTDYDTLSDEEKKEFLRLINRSAHVSTRLLDNLLLWARVQTGRLSPRPQHCRLAPLITTTCELYMNNAKQKEIEIDNKVSESAAVYADREMLEFIIRNLLSNAVKFTEKGGKVVFSAAEGFLHGHRKALSLSVQDTGVGMTPGQADDLFTIGGNRSTAGTSNEEGSGLGLIICKEFAEHNGGTISVKSTPGEGTVFTVTLPEA